MPTPIHMPQLGESVVEGTVMTWLKKTGEPVEEFDLLVEINTDKVATEIPSPVKGTLLAILVPEGETVAAGTLLAWVGEPGEAVPKGSPQPKTPAETPAGETKPDVKTESTSSIQPPADLGFISPVVANLARENQVDLTRVKGSGMGGRITKKDVLAYLETRSSKTAGQPAAWETPGDGDLFRPSELMTKIPSTPPTPEAKPQASDGDRLIPHSIIRKSIAAHMLASKHDAPHVTTVMEADLKQVVAHRTANYEAYKRDGINLTYTAYFASAAVSALRDFPNVNSSWSEDALVIHRQINLGMAVSLGEEGLIVPVIHNADGLSLPGIARTINDLGNRARAHQLKPDEVHGGTFTITNHGGSGSLFATPIINQPQCAILGVGIIQKRVIVLTDDSIAVRPMVYLSLTFDHRILDGSSADGFLSRVVTNLENWT